MRKINLELNLFEKGDFVRTPQGVGKVKKNQEPPENINSIFQSFVSVKHKSGTSQNPSNEKVEMPYFACIHIAKKEYDEEK